VAIAAYNDRSLLRLMIQLFSTLVGLDTSKDRKKVKVTVRASLRAMLADSRHLGCCNAAIAALTIQLFPTPVGLHLDYQELEF
jgi:hypothetical protein